MLVRQNGPEMASIIQLVCNPAEGKHDGRFERSPHSGKHHPQCQETESAVTHYEIWKYCQSTSKMQARVLQNLRVLQPHTKSRSEKAPQRLKLRSGRCPKLAGTGMRSTAKPVSGRFPELFHRPTSSSLDVGGPPGIHGLREEISLSTRRPVLQKGLDMRHSNFLSGARH